MERLERQKNTITDPVHFFMTFPISIGGQPHIPPQKPSVFLWLLLAGWMPLRTHRVEKGPADGDAHSAEHQQQLSPSSPFSREPQAQLLSSLLVHRFPQPFPNQIFSLAASAAPGPPIVQSPRLHTQPSSPLNVRPAHSLPATGRPGQRVSPLSVYAVLLDIHTVLRRQHPFCSVPHTPHSLPRVPDGARNQTTRRRRVETGSPLLLAFSNHNMMLPHFLFSSV